MDLPLPETPNEQADSEVYLLPASSIQGRYWLIDRLSPGTPAYNSPIVMRLTGLLDAGVLTCALNDIVRRHEALRTSFRLEGGELLQVIAPGLAIDLATVDLTASPAEEREAQARALIQEHGSISLNLTSGPLIVCKLIRISPENHILAVTTHQIVSDGWSNGILVRDVALTYDALASGRAGLPVPALQYADFALWHHAWLASEQAAAAREFWLSKLADPLPSLDLPADRPRRPGKVFPGAVESELFPEALMDRLSIYAREHSTTLYVVLMAAFQILMKCYSRQERFVITSSSAGRSQPGLEETFGRFAHPQILVADLEGDPSFEALTGRIQNWCTDAWTHQDFPLEKILEALGTDREDFRAPEFRAYFVFQKAFMHIHRTGTLTLTPMLSVVGGASVDLGFGIVERLEGTRVHVEYNSELYDAGTIRRMLAQYKTVLGAVVDNPRLRLSKVPVLPPAEREKVLVEFNRTPAGCPIEGCLPELVERQAAASPERTAIVYGDRQWTYRQLNARANRIAWYLRRLGVSPGERVGIDVSRSPETLAAILGVLKAGAAYVPVPARQIAAGQAGARQADSGIPRYWLTGLEAQAKEIDRESTENPPLQGDAGTLAVHGDFPQSHRSLVNVLAGMQSLLRLGASDVVAAITGIDSSRSTVEIFLPLIAGCAVAIASEEQATDPVKLRAWLGGSGVTVVQSDPENWTRLIAHGWQGDSKLKILCGGSAMTRALADALLERGGEVWNLYGTGRCAVWSSAHRVTRGSGKPSIGGPLPNTQFYVLNALQEPVPVGVPGELYIGGAGIAPSGSRLDEVSSFLPNRFQTDTNTHLYRTGDLVKFLPGGTLEFLGRVDGQHDGGESEPVSPVSRALAYEPPRDAMEARLVEIWERVLNVHPIGVKTNFFELGGYSLTVVRLFAQVNKIFDRNLPIATIFSAPTIEELANAIRGEIVSRSLVPIQEQGSQEPLFVLHSYLLYDGLRQVLGNQRPIYGLQELEDDKGRVFQLQDRVDLYVREIRSVQPHGPYHLIGWCAAGTLTLEVARALRAAGEEVALLGLIDASRPGYAAESRERAGLPARLTAKWRFHRIRFELLSSRQKSGYVLKVLRRNARTSWRRLMLKYWKLVYRECRRFGIAPPDFMHNVSWVTFASTQEHRIRPYDGPITLFRAIDDPASLSAAPDEDSTLGWQDVALGKVEVLWVPGDHESMFHEPNLGVFGETLRKALSAAQDPGFELQTYTGQFA